MCGCEPNFVCSRCTGDLRQDWRMQHTQDPREVEEERRYAELTHPLQDEAGITRTQR